MKPDHELFKLVSSSPENEIKAQPLQARGTSSLAIFAGAGGAAIGGRPAAIGAVLEVIRSRAGGGFLARLAIPVPPVSACVPAELFSERL